MNRAKLYEDMQEKKKVYEAIGMTYGVETQKFQQIDERYLEAENNYLAAYVKYFYG